MGAADVVAGALDEEGLGLAVAVLEGDDVAVSVGVGLGDRVGVGDVVVTLGENVLVGVDVANGSVKSTTSVPSRAPAMKAVQICAGYDPPVTAFIPPVPAKLTGCPSGPSLTNITAVANCGVYPTNQAERLSLVVPVLPAAGRPKS